MKKSFLLPALIVFTALGILTPAASAAPTGSVNAVTSWTDTYSGGGFGNAGWTSTAGNPSNGKSAAAFFADHGEADPVYKAYYIQILNADGSPDGAPIEILSPAQYYYYGAPVISYNPSTKGWTAFFYVGDEDFGADGPQILSYQVSQAGALVGAPTTVLDPDGNSFFNQGTARFYSPSPSAPWDPQEERFLYGGPMFNLDQTVTPGNSDDNAAGLFVGGNGQPQTGEMKLLTDFEGGCCGVGIDFATKSRNYLVGWWGEIDVDAEAGSGPITQLLDENGNRIGTPDRLLPDNSKSIGVDAAYNPVRDEFFVVSAVSRYDSFCSDTTLPVACGVYAWRIGADDGQLIGDRITLVTTTSVDNLESQYRRPQVAFNTAGGDEALVTWTTGNWDAGQNVSAQRVSGDGSLIDAAPQNVSESFGGVDSVHQRPSVGFNAKSCEYMLTWQYIADASASAKPQNIASRAYSSGGCKSSGNKPTLSKKGASAGSTSLKVRVGCAGGGSCRIKLSGKLLGGSGKLKGKTVRIGSSSAAGARAKASRTVTLSYSRKLIRELRRNGGGKIRVKAKEVGGGSKTITVTVPAPVTG